VSPCQTSAHMTQLIMPQYANSLGITFGGQVRRCGVLPASTRGLTVAAHCCRHLSPVPEPAAGIWCYNVYTET